jgi:murein DD-endopeptidase MepM/ murein hydrolase activator NlpD
MAKNNVLVFLLLLFVALSSFTQDTQEPQDDSHEYPVITELSTLRDKNFAEYSRQVEAASRAIKRKRSDFAPAFFTYTAGPKDTVNFVASRCGIPKETLATLNGIRSVDENLDGRTLVLSTAPGIFVAETPSNPVETLVFRDNPSAWSSEYASSAPSYEHITVGGRTFAWNGMARFSSEALIFFLDPGFALPLADFRFTSAYGNRPDPFGATGTWQFHRGVDLAAPSGTPVKAAKGGVVSEVDFNTVYGNYVIIRHTNNMQSLYGHLSRTLVAKEDAVLQGQTIGEVGTTGQSTGPHLHFEIRSGDTARNPTDLIKGIF